MKARSCSSVRALLLVVALAAVVACVVARTTAGDARSHRAMRAAQQRQFKAAVDSIEDEPTVWSCNQIDGASLQGGIEYQKLNCSAMVPFWGQTGPGIVNVVRANLNTPGVRLQPLQAASNPAVKGELLQPLNEIAASSGLNTVAGINGGYFWRLDSATFVDSVCQGKTADMARQTPDADPAHANYGTGDGTLVVNGVLMSNNCNCTGYNRPVVVSTPAGAPPTITLLGQGAPAAQPLVDSLSAGPNLLSVGPSGTFIDIPKDDQNIGNILEHSANTGMALRNSSTEVIFFTFDGSDKCKMLPVDPTCGFNAFQLAYFARDYLDAEIAMGMDQGGSTTMFVQGQGQNGIVSSSGGLPRPIYSALFLVVDATAVDADLRETETLIEV